MNRINQIKQHWLFNQIVWLKTMRFTDEELQQTVWGELFFKGSKECAFILGKLGQGISQ